MQYAGVIWDNCSEFEKQFLESVQHKSARAITSGTRSTSGRQLRNEVAFEEISLGRKHHKLVVRIL